MSDFGGRVDFPGSFVFGLILPYRIILGMGRFSVSYFFGSDADFPRFFGGKTMVLLLGGGG